MKKLLYLSPLFLVGCAATEWLVQNGAAIEAGADTAEALGGPYGALLGLGGTTILGLAKWWEHKSTAKEVIAATQAAKQNLSKEAKVKLAEGYDEYMPESVKKYVAKVKSKL